MLNSLLFELSQFRVCVHVPVLHGYAMHRRLHPRFSMRATNVRVCRTTTPPVITIKRQQLVHHHRPTKQHHNHEQHQAFAKLTALGCPAKTVPGNVASTAAPVPKTADEEFREHAMHGSLERMVDIGARANPDSHEPLTLRTALHKAAFWGHDHVVKYLISRGVNVDAQDMDGATALHGAMQFGAFLHWYMVILTRILLCLRMLRFHSTPAAGCSTQKRLAWMGLKQQVESIPADRLEPIFCACVRACVCLCLSFGVDGVVVHLLRRCTQ